MARTCMDVQTKSVFAETPEFKLSMLRDCET